MSDLVFEQVNEYTQHFLALAASSNRILLADRRRRMRNIPNQPWNSPPEGRQPFNQVGTLAVADTTTDTLETVLSFRVPEGWDGIANRIILDYTGNNFDQGSGQIVFSVKIDGVYQFGWENILTTMGSLGNGEKVEGGGFAMGSGQLVEIEVFYPNTFAPQATASFIGALAGYFYPRGVARSW